MRRAFSRHALSLSLLLIAGAFVSARADEVEGVTLKGSIVVGKRELSLNGIGVRTNRLLGIPVRVYVAGLYVEHPSTDAAQITSADEVKRVELVFLRDVAKETVVRAIADGFERNAGEKLPALRERLDQLSNGLPDVKQGDDVVLTYEPGRGTTATVNGEVRCKIDGRDFAEALVSVWLGAKPVDDELKRALLRGARSASEPSKPSKPEPKKPEPSKPEPLADGPF